MSEFMKLIIGTLQYQWDCAKELILLTTGGVLVAILFNKRGWRSELRRLFPSSLRVNLIVYLVDALIVTMSITMLVGLIYRNLGSGGLMFFSPIVEKMPVWVIGIVSVAVGDFVGYWRHRLEHSRILWPAHSLHHSDEEMTWFTLFRFHPINRISTAAIDYSVLFLLGFPLWAIALAGSLRHFYGMFVHIDRPWTLGIAGWLLVSPAMHRWHHVRKGQGMHSNYATIFSVFDRAFGTFYVPGPCNEKLGVEGVNHTEYLSQMLLPFSELWRKLCALRQYALSARN